MDFADCSNSVDIPPLAVDSMSDCVSVKKQVALDMRDQAYRLCREFLSGSWKRISSADMVFERVNGGLSNLLYYCSLPKTHTPLNDEPQQVLLRMYGQLHFEGMETSMTESIVFMLLSERNLGPKLYGVFPEGRLEEYIPARALMCHELKNPEISATIARKLAMVHSLNVPINKEPTWLFDRMSSWLEHIRTKISLNDLERNVRYLAEPLLMADLEGELNWLRSYLQEVGSPTLFCHNDLQEGNILLPDNSATKDRLVFIDFEFCSYNYRGFDIGNHFCEWCFDYSNPDYPKYTAKLEDYPSEEQQLHFIRAYLSSLGPQMPAADATNTEEHILHEATAFALASHFLWALWSIYNAQSTEIQFGYWEYGKSRLDAYYKCKSQLPDIQRTTKQ